MTITPDISIDDVPAYMAAHVVSCVYGRLRAIHSRYGEQLAFHGVLDASPWPQLAIECEVDPFTGRVTVNRTDYVDPPGNLGPGSGVYWTTISAAASTAVNAYLATEAGTELLSDHLTRILRDLDTRILDLYGRRTPPGHVQTRRTRILQALVRLTVGDEPEILEVATGLAEDWAFPQSVEDLIDAARLLVQRPR